MVSVVMKCLFCMVLINSMSEWHWAPHLKVMAHLFHPWDCSLCSAPQHLFYFCISHSTFTIIFSHFTRMTRNPSKHWLHISSHYSISIMFRQIGVCPEMDRSFCGSWLSASDLAWRRACQFSQWHSQAGDRLVNNAGLEVLMCLISLWPSLDAFCQTLLATHAIL